MIFHSYVTVYQRVLSYSKMSSMVSHPAGLKSRETFRETGQRRVFPLATLRPNVDDSDASPCHEMTAKKSTNPTVWIQTLSEKVLKPPNYIKLYPKHFLSEGTWIHREKDLMR
jgi:hypothetical protein